MQIHGSKNYVLFIFFIFRSAIAFSFSVEGVASRVACGSGLSLRRASRASRASPCVTVRHCATPCSGHNAFNSMHNNDKLYLNREMCNYFFTIFIF